MKNIIDKITNIDFLGDRTISLSRVLLLFYMMIAANYTTNLISKQMQTFLETNRIAQHVIGIIGMFVLITTFGDVENVKLSIIYSLLAYGWFILTTKLDIHINAIILALLVIGYIYEDNMDITQLKANKSLEETQIYEMIDNNKKNKRNVVIAIFIVTLIGTLLYNDRKLEQYGGGYDLTKFLLY